MGSSRSAALKVALTYAVAAGLWIVFSDSLVGLLPGSIEDRLQTGKGLLFVLVTALTLYTLVLSWGEQVLRETRRSESVERVLAQVVDTVPVGVLLLSDEGVITFVNPAAESLLSIEGPAAVGRRLDELGVVEGAEDLASVGTLLSTGTLDGLKLKAPDGGDARAVIARAAAVDETAPGSGWVVAVADITDAHTARERADRLVRSYQYLSEAAISMTRSTDRIALLTELCRLAVERAGFAGAWAYYGDLNVPEASESVFVGPGEATRGAAELVEDALAPDSQLATRLVEGEIVVSNDVARDPRSPWYTAANDDGFGSLASFAVGAPGDVMIAITLFAHPAGFFTSDQVALLRTFRNSLGFAVDRMSLDQRRIEAEEALESSERSYRSLFESHPQPMWVYDIESLAFLAVNDAAVARYGYTRDEFLAMKITDVRPKEEIPRLLRRLEEMPKGFADAGVWAHRDKSGRDFPVHVHTHTIDWLGREAELVMVMEVAHVE